MTSGGTRGAVPVAAVAVAALIAALTPAHAGAGAVTAGSDFFAGNLRYEDELSETNTVELAISADRHRIEVIDSTAAIYPAAASATTTLQHCTFAIDRAECVENSQNGWFQPQLRLGAGADTAVVPSAAPGAAGPEIDGGAGDDVLAGGSGKVGLTGGQGADALSGGAGEDWARYTDVWRTGGVAVSLDGAGGDGAPGEGDNVSADVENLEGTNFADTLVGNGHANTLFAYGGADTIRSGNGDDTVVLFEAAAGVDRVNCGPGTDTVTDARPGDRLVGCEIVQ